MGHRMLIAVFSIIKHHTSSGNTQKLVFSGKLDLFGFVMKFTSVVVVVLDECDAMSSRHLIFLCSICFQQCHKKQTKYRDMTHEGSHNLPLQVL